ncbi:hypothetical protein F6X40_28670 [Paraburkholderia sp. UCT31]|uniref:hypothetical protein n=1 Tax=Paraburkholderia sp. UCT31 TaxID=2615209 RepID=UPI00165527E2|nr:hypothetical protein [Paraburkholderia sp. UCT31]MBC8740608.1 hypothetical protein [Paraburkholderia sp. UCT31]
MADAYGLTLPDWLTLERAAEWLTERTHAGGVKWTVDSLLGTLCTGIGPLADIHESLPVWLLTPSLDFHVVTATTAGQRIESASIPITHETLRLFCVHSSIDSAMVGVRFADGTDARLTGGTAIPRGWLAVRGFDLLMFLVAYAGLRKDLEATTHASNDEPPAKHSDWRDAARAIADELYARDKDNGVRGTLDGYSKRVLEVMQQRGIPGPKGRYDNPGTVKREALQGDKWWAKKQK